MVLVAEGEDGVQARDAGEGDVEAFVSELDRGLDLDKGEEVGEEMGLVLEFYERSVVQRLACLILTESVSEDEGGGLEMQLAGVPSELSRMMSERSVFGKRRWY